MRKYRFVESEEDWVNLILKKQTLWGRVILWFVLVGMILGFCLLAIVGSASAIRYIITDYGVSVPGIMISLFFFMIGIIVGLGPIYGIIRTLRNENNWNLADLDVGLGGLKLTSRLAWGVKSKRIRLSKIEGLSLALFEEGNRSLEISLKESDEKIYFGSFGEREGMEILEKIQSVITHLDFSKSD